MNNKFFVIILSVMAWATSAWADGIKWEYNPYDFQYDMTAYVNLNVDGSPVGDISDYSIAAFCGDECRGIMEVKNSGGLQYGYFRIRSNKENGEQITFKVYDNKTGIYLKCKDVLNFVSQGVTGMPGTPFTLSAANKYKVDYVADDVVCHTDSVYYGEEIALIQGAPDKTGYTFVEWVNVPEVMPAHDVIVTASYSINSYKLVFKIGDEVVSEEEVEYNSEIVAPAAPEKEGLTFAGWDEYPTTMPANDLTVNGSYTVNKYKLTYIIGDVTVSETEVEYGTALTAIEAPEKEGYLFDGWVGLPETMPAHDVTVTGSYTVNSYNLVFVIDGVVISEQAIAPNSAIVEPIAPEKEGYTFAGWDEHPTSMPAHDLTINGSYVVNKYKLAFVVDDTTVSETEVEYGSAVSAIDAPEKEGYTFVGWGGVPETMPAHDVIVTGSYTVNSYKLAFVIGEEVVSETDVEYGSEIVEPTAPEKEGYTFAGWDEHPTSMPAHDLTINGSYVVNKYKLAFVVDNITVSESEVEYGSAVNAIDALEKEGYTFAGWVGVPETMPAHDVIVTGSYTVNSYKLAFVIGEELVSETVVEYGSEIVEPTAPEKEGYTFAGWDEHPTSMPAHDLTINGSYVVNKYKLTFVVDDATVSEAEVEYGSVVNAIDSPEKEGYTFAGWVGVPETMPAHDVIVTGSYTVNSYKLVFAIGEEFVSETVVEYGSEIVDPTAPEKEGYTFVGWDEHSTSMPAHDLTINGSYVVNKYKLTFVVDDITVLETEVKYGSAVNAIDALVKIGYTFAGWVGVPETMPAHDVIVTGSYTINSYKLVFAIGEEVVSETVVEYGSEIVEPTAPEKEGYTFVGWDDYLTSMPAYDLTINGSYVVNKYKLTYVIDDITVSEAEVDYGTELTIVKAPYKEGYTFAGWVGVPETMPAHDVTVTGSYTINSYLLVFMIDNDVISEKMVEYNSEIDEVAAPDKEGYTFAGWAEHPTTMPAHDLTVTGSYIINKYKLVFKIDDVVVSEEVVEYNSEIVEPTVESKEGYTFSGWEEHPYVMPANDLTITASYVVNSYKVLFMVDFEVVAEETFEYNEQIVAPEAPEKVGYTFIGWQVLPETMPAHDIRVYGLYVKNTYTVTYMVGDDVVRVDNVKYGEKLPEAPDAPEREGYVFQGWSNVPKAMPAENIVITGNYDVSTGISHVQNDFGRVAIYDLQGNLVKSGVMLNDVKHQLQPGIYIINRHKVVIK